MNKPENLTYSQSTKQMNFMGSDISEIVPREIPHIHVPSLLFRFVFWINRPLTTGRLSYLF